MKYAFMSFSAVRATLAESLALARRIGYDGFEPRSGSGHAHGVELGASAEQRRAIRDQADAAGVALCCLATGCRLADPADTSAQKAEARRYIDLAADIGAPVLRLFGGAFPQTQTRAAAVARVADALGDLADHAADRGVRLAMETHDSWCDPSDVASVMAAVDHPAVGVNWDLMHPLRVARWSMERTVAALGRWIIHCHVHDAGADVARLDWAPIGHGVVDHRLALRLLSAAGYGGYLSGEWINWEAAETHLPRELATLKALEKDPA